MFEAMFGFLFWALMVFVACAIALVALWYMKVLRVILILVMAAAAVWAGYAIFNLAHGHF